MTDSSELTQNSTHEWNATSTMPQDANRPLLEVEVEELNAVGEAIQENFYEAKKELYDAPASTVSQEKDADKPILEALFRIPHPHLPMTEKDDEFSLRDTTLLSSYPRRLFLILKSWYKYHFFAKTGQWEIVLAVLFILAAVSTNVGIGTSFGLSTSDNVNYWQWGNTLIASNGISLYVCTYFEIQWGIHLASVQWDLKQAEDLPRVRLIVARCWILFLNFCTGIVQAVASFKERAAIKEQLSAAQEQLSTAQEPLSAAQEQLSTAHEQPSAAQEQLSTAHEQPSAAQEQAQDLSNNFNEYQRSVELCFFRHNCTDVCCSLDCLKLYTLSDPI